MKEKHFKIQDGQLIETYQSESIVSGKNKSEALAKILNFAKQAIERPPGVKVKNGAYQLNYATLDGRRAVESGIEGRNIPLCCSSVPAHFCVKEDAASFDYYSSKEYRES